jgi:site-specific DNA-methyltransferase (adenine-specific)
VIEGVPHTLEGAQDLWERDKHQFQKWAIEQIDGFVTSRKTADGGIDGRLYFSVPGERDLQSMVIEVKGGKSINPTVLRDLRGVLEREQAMMAGLIIMDDLGTRKMANFHREMGRANDLDINGIMYPRMQILTVPEILEGKRFKTPSVARGRSVSQPALPLG